MTAFKSHSDGVGGIFDFIGSVVDQVGIVVPDLEAAATAHAAVGPFAVYSYNRAFSPGLHVAGVSADFSWRIALNSTQPQIELLSPAGVDGPFAEWADRHGSGVHHLGFLVESVGYVTERFAALGFNVLMGGAGHGIDGTGEFCYYDTEAAVGYIVEAISRDIRRRKPEKVIP